MQNLLPIVEQLHVEAYKLCNKKFGKYFSNAGNIGIFCQSDEEYKQLTILKDKITRQDTNPMRKYFELIDPITIEKKENIPEAKYTHLYIRKPDPSPYGKLRGDIDFYTTENELEILKSKVNETQNHGVEIYNQKGVGDLIQMSDSKYETVAYISTKKITENIRFRAE